MSDFVVAETQCGRVRGRVRDGVNVFKGIPYGADTSGDARFLPPRAAVPWDGVRAALEYGPSAPQSDPDAGPADSAITALIGNMSDLPESEDCLVLNIFTSSLSAAAKRPVMLWIHGGGFQSGSGSSPGYDGRRLVQRGDVVVVSINHRLNVFGFLCTGEARTGNAGMLDIVQALRWVRDNIESFGGDPACVTIFGESGGGRKVGTLLAMPEAKGLFTRAIIQSGPSYRAVTREYAAEVRRAIFEELQLAEGDVEGLRRAPAAELLRAYFAGTRKHAWNHVVSGLAPMVDGDVLPSHPFDPQASAVMPDVPLIVGTNRTEMTLFLAGDKAAFELDEAGLTQRAQKWFGKHAESLLDVYRSSQPDATPSELFFLMISDSFYCAALMAIAERRAALGGAPVYFYYFCWETPIADGKLRSAHALDISFVFDNTERAKRFTGGGERPAALAAKLSAAWIAFASTGKPSAEGLPEWPPYTAERRTTLVIDDNPKLVDDPTRERRQAMQKFLGI
ncbi:MAG TPA: carboxylesterase family protein [Polyangiales bacterium]|nr:carboxylesterase family protein [Polyangiales bacterium]